MKKRVLFVTGGTGFLGKAIIAKLCADNQFDRIVLLIRGNAQKRLDELITTVFPHSRRAALAEKLEAVSGDLVDPGLGLKDATALAEQVTTILHVGASTEFGAPLAEARKYNLEGTKHVFEFAQQCHKAGSLERFDYISTAFVAGTKGGIVDESDLQRRQHFANSYEQSKYEAEVFLRSQRDCGFPITTHRPSIVVGNSKNGFTPHFKVLYWPLRLLSKDFLPFFATNIDSRLDVVPVDYVADAVATLLCSPATVGGTFHITAGLGNEVKIREFLHDAYRFMGIKRRPIIPFWLFRIIQNSPLSALFPNSFWDATELAEPYYAYLRGTNVRFNNSQTQRILDEFHIAAPRWDSYKKEILAYCIDSRWGKRKPLPEYVYYLPRLEAAEGSC